MFSENLNGKLGKRERAVKIANVILREISKGKGVIGGTKRKSEKNIIRETDRTLIGRNGLCGKHRGRQLIEIDIEEYDLAYRVSSKKIRKILPDVSYVSGLGMANPVARFLMYEFSLEKINSVTLKELVVSPRVPVVSDTQEGNKEKWYSYKVEDFRVILERPNWILRVVNYDFPEMNYPWITKGKDGIERRIPEEKAKRYLTRTFVPVATGTEWVVDYGILALLPDPFNSGRKIVLVGGAHWLSTFALNAMLYLVERVPELNLEIEGVIDSMRWLFDAVYGKVEFFEAIFRVTDSYFGRRRKIDIDPVGLFNMDHSSEKIMERDY